MDRIPPSSSQSVNNPGFVGGKKEVVQIDLYHKNLKSGNKNCLPCLSDHLLKVKQGEYKALLTQPEDPSEDWDYQRNVLLL